MANIETNRRAVKKKKKKTDKSNTPGTQCMMGLLLHSTKWWKGKKIPDWCSVQLMCSSNMGKWMDGILMFMRFDLTINNACMQVLMLQHAVFRHIKKKKHPSTHHYNFHLI